MFMQFALIALFFIHSALSCQLKNLVEALSELAAASEQRMPFSSIWSTPKGTTMMPKIFQKDCKHLFAENKKIPSPAPGNLRIVSYNVHFWTSPFKKDTLNKIISILNTLKADVTLLQEAYFDKDADTGAAILFPILSDLKYTHHQACSSKLPTTPFFFGNIILTKFTPTEPPLTYQFTEPAVEDLRCFINVKTKIHTTTISLYGMHLAIQEGCPADSMRKSELEELFTYINKDSSDIIIVAADFNAFREQDYRSDIWQKILKNTAKHMSASIEDVPTKTLKIFEEHGFNDSFAFSHQKGPGFTVWTGTVVDFMFIKDTRNDSQKKQHPLHTKSYVYYSAASDHLPLILDLTIQ